VHFFKLFLAASFAVCASMKGIVTIIGLYASSLLPSVGIGNGAAYSLLGAGISFFAGGVIARRLSHRRVAKATSN
jgi:ethanolamine transporter EutH